MSVRRCIKCKIEVWKYKRYCPDCYKEKKKEDQRYKYKYWLYPSLIKRKRKNRKKVCPYCSNDFVSNVDDQVFCTSSCATHKRLWYIFNHTICYVCWEWFYQNGNKKKVCSEDCRNIYRAYLNYMNNTKNKVKPLKEWLENYLAYKNKKWKQ